MKSVANFDLLTLQGPGQGYHPEPSKSVLIARPKNLEARKVFRRWHGFKVCTVAHYLEGYIENNESKHDWLRKHTMAWEKNISMIRKNAGKCLQESYDAVVRAIQ